MRVGYFINQYPSVSHTFIRREIQALEKLGVAVVRYALRSPTKDLVDAQDKAEWHKTRHIQSAGARAILISGAATLLRRPVKTMSVFRLAVRMGWKSDRGLWRHLAYALEGMILGDWARRDGVEHIHAHFGTNSAAIAMFASQLAGIPYSFTAHGSEEFEKAPLLSLDVKLRNAAFAVCVSSFGRAQLMRWTPVELWPRIAVVHCGLDPSFLAGEAASIPTSRRFVCVGRLGEHKAQLVLVKAVRRLRDEGIGCEVVLAGDGPMRPDIEKAIHRAGLQSEVTITGWISGDRVKAELVAARAMVLPSFSENMPVVIMEALALGRPVISTYIAGIPELVQPGQTGWLVPSSDDEALAQALREALAASPQQLAAMGAHGRQHVSEQHSAGKEAAKLKDLFQASIERRDAAVSGDVA